MEYVRRLVHLQYLDAGAIQIVQSKRDPSTHGVGLQPLGGAKGWAVEVRRRVGEEVNKRCTFSASGTDIPWRGFSDQVCRGDVVFLCWYFFLDAS